MALTLELVLPGDAYFFGDMVFVIVAGRLVLVRAAMSGYSFVGN